MSKNIPPNDHIQSHSGCREWFYAPFGCLLRISPFVILGIVILGFLGFLFIYNNVNIDILGIGKPNFDKWVISNDFGNIQDEHSNYWNITYEFRANSEFSGLVRHVNPIREDLFNLLTHDILVTSGDYADPQKVETNVANHHFTWRSLASTYPEGKINLLHIVPATEDIYRKLLQVQSGTQLAISGREILKIEAFDPQDQFLGFWQDTGCNTILVTSVQLK